MSTIRPICSLRSLQLRRLPQRRHPAIPVARDRRNRGLEPQPKVTWTNFLAAVFCSLPECWAVWHPARRPSACPTLNARVLKFTDLDPPLWMTRIPIGDPAQVVAEVVAVAAEVARPVAAAATNPATNRMVTSLMRAAHRHDNPTVNPRPTPSSLLAITVQ